VPSQALTRSTTAIIERSHRRVDFAKAVSSRRRRTHPSPEISRWSLGAVHPSAADFSGLGARRSSRLLHGHVEHQRRPRPRLAHAAGSSPDLLFVVGQLAAHSGTPQMFNYCSSAAPSELRSSRPPRANGEGAPTITSATSTKSAARSLRFTPTAADLVPTMTASLQKSRAPFLVQAQIGTKLVKRHPPAHP
jgi:hypothetical protein